MAALHIDAAQSLDGDMRQVASEENETFRQHKLNQSTASQYFSEFSSLTRINDVLLLRPIFVH
jgi:hypothetical protein